MRFFAWILLLAASTSVDLVDEVYRIPASEWRYVELSLNQQPAQVRAEYHVEDGSREVRVALMLRSELERLREGLPQGVVAVSPPGQGGGFSYQVAGSGDYVVVVDNRGSQPATVRLRIRLDFAHQGPAVTRLSPERRRTVILISFAVFFGIVTWSARRLLRGIRR